MYLFDIVLGLPLGNSHVEVTRARCIRWVSTISLGYAYNTGYWGQYVVRGPYKVGVSR